MSTGFQTTYEELKPPFIGNDEQTHEGFQTTYEELKLVKTGTVTGRFGASRLPMRN